MQTIAANQASAEIPINENFATLGWAEVYGKRQPATAGLTWGFYGGRWSGMTVADGTLTLTNNATNYVTVARATGAISVSTATTAWFDTPNHARVYQLTTAGGVVTAEVDVRGGAYGVHGGPPRERRLNSRSADYTFTAADADTIVLHPSADTSARTFTVPANASVAYPLGSELEVINQNGAGVVTIAITSDTMRLAGAGTTGSRTLAANGMARLVKLSATEWIIDGVGLT